MRNGAVNIKPCCFCHTKFAHVLALSSYTDYNATIISRLVFKCVLIYLFKYVGTAFQDL